MPLDARATPPDSLDVSTLRFDLTDLETFLAVVELGSFSGAAKRMHVSQPAVTSRVQKLESVLKTTLVARTTRNVMATPDGEMLAERARDALQGLRDLMRDFQSRAAQTRLRTVIATTPMLAAVVLPPLIQSFRTAHPTMQVQVRDLQYEDVLTTVERGEADLAVTAFDDNSTKLHFEPLAREPMLLVLPKSHPLADVGSIALAQLATLPLMLLDRYAQVQTRLAAECDKHGLRLGPIQHATNVGTVLGLVDAGLGVTLLPRYMAQRSLMDSRAVLEVPAIDLSRSFGILYRGKADLNPATSLFFEHLRTHFARMLRG